MKITYNKEKQNYDMTCCDNPELFAIEYDYDHPEQYDGISEYRCQSCGYRQGRWSGKELTGEDYELRYGREK